MPKPSDLPRTLTIPLNKTLMVAALTYCEFSDVTKSRLVQRALGRELSRLMRNNPQLKAKIERATKKYGTFKPTGNNGE